MKELFQTYSNSQRALFAECPRKYSYKYIEDLAEETGVAASFSSECVHPLMQVLHLSPWADLEDNPEKYAMVLYAQWSNKIGLQALKSPHCSLATLQKIVKQYLPIVQADKAEGWECKGVEVSRILPAHAESPALRYTSKLDVLESKDGVERPVEFKFSASSVEKVWEMDSQLVGYAACCGVDEVMLVEIKCERGRKGEAGKVTVSRGVVRIQPDILAEWLEEMSVGRSALTKAWKANVWPKETGSCWRWGRMCEFSELCRAGAARKFMMAGMDKKGRPNAVTTPITVNLEERS